MTLTSNRLWLLGTMMLTVVVLVAGWFLGVSPSLTHAATVNEDRATVEAQNAAHVQTLESLKTRFAQIETLSKEVDVIRTAVPSAGQLPQFLGQLNGLGAAHQVAITKVTVSEGVPFVSFVPVTSDEVAVETDSAETEPATAATVQDSSVEVAVDGASAVPVPNAELVTSDSFVAVPIVLSATGGYDQVMNFVAGLQSGPRLFLVSSLDVGPNLNVETDAVSFNADVSGFVYVLLAPQTSEGVTEALPESEVTTTGTLN